MAEWPRRKVERFRQTLSGVYASAMLAGSLYSKSAKKNEVGRSCLSAGEGGFGKMSGDCKECKVVAEETGATTLYSIGFEPSSLWRERSRQ